MNSANIRLLCVAIATMLFAASCGGGSDGESTSTAAAFVEQGAATLDDASVVPDDTADEGDGGAGASESEDPATDDADVEETSDTLPQNEDDEPAAAGLFTALQVFTSCISDEGYEFIGRPDPSLEADDPVNDSGYGEALGHCAAVSQILESFQALEEESSNLDTEGIEDRNRQLVHWMDCMEGRGWVMDGVTTDERGLNQPAGMEPPDGQSFLDSTDMGECATVAGAAYEEELEAEGA